MNEKINVTVENEDDLFVNIIINYLPKEKNMLLESNDIILNVLNEKSFNIENVISSKIAIKNGEVQIELEYCKRDFYGIFLGKTINDRIFLALELLDIPKERVKVIDLEEKIEVKVIQHIFPNTMQARMGFEQFIQNFIRKVLGMIVDITCVSNLKEFN